MRLAMISCHAYSDAWHPFHACLSVYWPSAPACELWLDSEEGREPWRDVAIAGAKRSAEPVLLMQEDFFLTARVDTEALARGEALLREKSAGCVRIYPCPGSEGPAEFNEVPRGTPYRISCQAAIWDPAYLMKVLSLTEGSAASFELDGTPASKALTEKVFAWNRSRNPWPMEYLCTAIVRGLWSQGAKVHCDALGIAVDWSRRGFQAA